MHRKNTGELVSYCICCASFSSVIVIVYCLLCMFSFKLAIVYLSFVYVYVALARKNGLFPIARG